MSEDSRRAPRLAAVFVQHDREKYPHSLLRLLSALGSLPAEVHVAVVDNAQDGDWVHPVGARLWHLAGDNSAWEFSAFDKGLAFFEQTTDLPFDVLAIATDALLAYGDEFLELVDARALEVVLSLGAAVGWMDRFPEPCRILDWRYAAWLRTSLLLLPTTAVSAVRPLNWPLAAEKLFSDDPLQPFAAGAPLSANLQTFLTAWLTTAASAEECLDETWHSRFDLDAGSLPQFRAKVASILREHLLSARLAAAGVPCFDLRLVRRMGEEGRGAERLRDAPHLQWLGWVDGTGGPRHGDRMPRFLLAGSTGQAAAGARTSSVEGLVRQRHATIRTASWDEGSEEQEAATDLWDVLEDCAAVLYGAGEGHELPRCVAGALLAEVPLVGPGAVLNGLSASPDVEFLPAETDVEYARQACRLIEESGLGKELSAAARRLLARVTADAAAAGRLAPRRVGGWEEYRRHRRELAPAYAARASLETALVPFAADEFSVLGHCHVCSTVVRFLVDYYAAGEREGHRWPNWRERLQCPGCGLNTRMRASVQIIEELLGEATAPEVYLTEATTRLFSALASRITRLEASEFLGARVPLGETNEGGVRNEDLTALTFEDARFDLVASFDVLEHVPDTRGAMAECARVLRPGGHLVATAPFRTDQRRTLVRARVREDGAVEHILPPEYHGDPLDPGGCLSFYEFGWDLLDLMREVGFASVEAWLFWSARLGYLGGEQLVLVARRGE